MIKRLRNLDFMVKCLLCFCIAMIFIFVATNLSCSKLKRSMRKDYLQESLKSFHLSFMSRNLPYVIMKIPSDERTRWAEAFQCYFNRYRLVDFKIQEIKIEPDNTEAKVTVWLTGHAIDSISIQEHLWVEEWVFQDRRWYLDPESESLRKVIGPCYPEN